MNRTAHVIRGLPGAGKTTLALLIAAETGAVHAELDVFKREVWPDVPRRYDPFSGPGLAVQEAYEQHVSELLDAGHNVIWDRTSLNPEGLRRLEALGARLIIHDLRDVPLAVCIDRDAERLPAFRVGADGIRALAHRWL